MQGLSSLFIVVSFLGVNIFVPLVVPIFVLIVSAKK